ncbi:hypothetical protein EJ08DRAFT_442840 [Tothia fuscella]|uniref:Uncharacterized protein n=1 Tax=Tothia fuscella TaxID=1048955 RepID=A0A9P4NJS3_9PEZI|nr:hypothetical protein EJ08DRAFT_442840 [Tothia fuscella]
MPVSRSPYQVQIEDASDSDYVPNYESDTSIESFDDLTDIDTPVSRTRFEASNAVPNPRGNISIRRPSPPSWTAYSSGAGTTRRSSIAAKRTPTLHNTFYVYANNFNASHIPESGIRRGLARAYANYQRPNRVNRIIPSLSRGGGRGFNNNPPRGQGYNNNTGQGRGTHSNAAQYGNAQNNPTAPTPTAPAGFNYIPPATQFRSTRYSPGQGPNQASWRNPPGTAPVPTVQQPATQPTATQLTATQPTANQPPAPAPPLPGFTAVEQSHHHYVRSLHHGLSHLARGKVNLVKSKNRSYLMFKDVVNDWRKPRDPVPLGGVIYATKYDTWLGNVPLPNTPDVGVFTDGRMCSGKKRPLIVVGHTDSVMVCVPIVSNPAVATEIVAVAPTDPSDAIQITQNSKKPVLQWKNPDHNDAATPDTWDTPAWCHYTQLCTVRYNEYYKVYDHELDDQSTYDLIVGIRNHCLPRPPDPNPPAPEQV